MYILFTGLNIYGVKIAATFELVVTALAVAELLLFSGVTLPHLKIQNLTLNVLPNGWTGIFAALPFAVWFFLGIEGVANVAEETINPQKVITKGFGFAILTLVILCIFTFISSVGVAGWEAIVYKNGTQETSDSPLPLAMAQVVGNNTLLYHLLITVGLFGLVASFHGLILAAGRATLEFGRAGNAPAFLGKVNASFKTPANALTINMLCGILALLTNTTGDIIILSVFGALSLYVISMISLIVLRRREPEMNRPFQVPFYPATPTIALIIASIALVAMMYYNFILAIIYFGILAICFFAYKLFKK